MWRAGLGAGWAEHRVPTLLGTADLIGSCGSHSVELGAPSPHYTCGGDQEGSSNVQGAPEVTAGRTRAALQ